MKRHHFRLKKCRLFFILLSFPSCLTSSLYLGIHPLCALFSTTITSIIVSIKIISFLVAIPSFVGVFVAALLQEFAELFGQQTKSFSFT